MKRNVMFAVFFVDDSFQKPLGCGPCVVGNQSAAYGNHVVLLILSLQES